MDKEIMVKLDKELSDELDYLLFKLNQKKDGFDEVNYYFSNFDEEYNGIQTKVAYINMINKILDEISQKIKIWKQLRYYQSKKEWDHAEKLLDLFLKYERDKNVD